MEYDEIELVKLYEKTMDLELGPERQKAIEKALSEQAKRDIGESLKVLEKYKDVFPQDVLEAMKTLAQMATEPGDYGYPKKPKEGDEDEEGVKKMRTEVLKNRWPSLTSPQVSDDDVAELAALDLIEKAELIDAGEAVLDVAVKLAGRYVELAKSHDYLWETLTLLAKEFVELKKGSRGASDQLKDEEDIKKRGPLKWPSFASGDDE